MRLRPSAAAVALKASCSAFNFDLLVPFAAQLVLPPSIGSLDVRMAFTALYAAAALGLLVDAHRRRAQVGSVERSNRAEPAERACADVR